MAHRPGKKLPVRLWFYNCFSFNTAAMALCALQNLTPFFPLLIMAFYSQSLIGHCVLKAGRVQNLKVSSACQTTLSSFMKEGFAIFCLLLLLLLLLLLFRLLPVFAIFLYFGFYGYFMDDILPVILPVVKLSFSKFFW